MLVSKSLGAALIVSLAVVGFAPTASPQSNTWEWTGVPRIVAMGDIHGRHHELVLALQATGLVDDELRWTGGRDHVVLCGDLVDRGAEDRAVLDLVRRLSGEAERAGGHVHALLGNHEVMNLMRDLRYVREGGFTAFIDDELASEREREWKVYRRKYSRKIRDQSQLRAAFLEAYPAGYFGRERAFSMGGEYGDWLTERPAVIRINGVLFLHGGLTPETAALGLTRINDGVREALTNFLKAVDVLAPHVIGPAGFHDLLSFANQAVSGSGRKRPGFLVSASQRLLDSLQSLGFDPHGPLWYRGNALANERIERDRFQSVLDALGATAMMVGHSVTADGEVTARFEHRLFRGDVGLGYGRDARPVIFENDTVVALDPRSGERAEPELEPLGGQGWGQSYVHLPDVLVETILREGEIAERTEASLGGYEVLELHRGSLKLRAVFKPFDRRSPSGARAEHELAAHALDRALGLNFVPVVVARRVDGKSGVLRPILESAIDLVSIRAYGNLDNADTPEIVAAVADFFELHQHELEKQVVEVTVLNALLGNSAREDIQNLFIPADGRIALVDHERAFPTTDDVAQAMSDGCDPMPAELTVMLTALDREELLPALADSLSADQIDALLARRDRILEMCATER